MSQVKIKGNWFNYQFTITNNNTTPLTLVHGVGADLTSWDQVINYLPQSHPILRYDQRGHGETEKIPGPYELDDFVEDLHELLNYLTIKKTHLVGFSLGGLVAQAFALKYPQKLDRLVLISTICGRTEKEKKAVLARAGILLEQGASTHLSNSVDRWFTDKFQRENPEIVTQRLEKSRTNDPASYAAAYRVLAESDLHNNVNEIIHPTLIMTGEHDKGSTPRMSKLLSDKITGSKLKILPDLKHSVLLESPSLIAQEIADFTGCPLP